MSEFLGGNLLTPRQRQERVLRKALELRVQFWAHGDDYLYRSGGDLLLQHGNFYSGRVLPEDYESLRGVPGRCFQNALDAVTQDPSLRYVEGVYAIGTSHYTPHAWCLDPEGNLLEVSLPTSGEIYENAVEEHTGLPVLGVEHWGYWGAVFHPEFVKAVWATQEGHVGMLDRPTADAGPGTHEWRDEWPILRVPYDPERRTL